MTEALLERTRAVDPELGVFVTLCADGARAAAQSADEELGAGIDRGPLHGVPVAVKDILATADAPTTAQSCAFDPAGLAGRDAAAVAALRRAGAVITGKTTLSEFAIGLPDPESPFPLPRNPWDSRRWAGGSSAGTAAGLAAGLFLGGLGTDTGGSVRLPASFSGITGLKPSAGLVSRAGCVPLAPSLDEIGPMATTAEDCALLLDALAATSGSREPFAAQLHESLGGVRIGVDRRHCQTSGVTEAAVAAFECAVVELEQAGAAVVELTIPEFELVSAATSIVLLAEALDCHRRNLRARWDDYGPRTRLRLAAGVFFSASEYVRARRVLAGRRLALTRALEPVDAVVTLTAGTSAWPIDDIVLNAPSLAPLFTRVWNGVGFPALSVPIGFDEHGLPLGMQIVGSMLADATVLRIGYGYQSVTDWHARRPSLTTACAEAGRAAGDS